MNASPIEQQQDLAQRFHDLAISWLALTRFRSNTQVLRSHSVYQELVALGEPIIPLILAEVKREPRASWFLILAEITGENPVSPTFAGRLDAMAKAWLDWGRERGLGSVSVELETAFSNLSADGYVMSSPKTQAYNCVAWAAGDAERWWEPGIYWPAPAGDHLGALSGLFASLGYIVCADDEHEPGYEKVALYADDEGNWTHAARQLPDGWWTSKLGPDEDILHRTPQALVGDLYGQVRAIMKRVVTPQ